MTNDFLKKIVNQSFDIICTITKNGEFVWVNDAVERTLGYMPKELIGKSYVQFLSAEDREKTTRATSDIIKGIKTSTFTNTYLSKEGSEVLLVWSARWDESEALLYCVARNITEIHIAEEKIKRNEEVFRTLVKEGAYLISIINPDATYKYVSQKHAEFLGVSENELIGKTALNYVHHLDRKALNEKFKELYDVNRIETKPYRLKNKNGEWRWVQSVATNLLDKHAIEGVVINTMDVTEIVLTQNELKISEQKYQNLFDTSPLPKWIYDLETFKILGVNKTAILQYGYSYEEFLSMTIFDIRPKAEIPKVKQGLQSLKNKRGIVRFGVFTHKRKDGSLILMELSGHRISFDGRKCMMIVGSDVTDRENTLRALEASEARYRGFYESQTNYVVRTDMKGNYTYANKKFIEDFAWIHGGKNIIGKNGMISICEYDHGKVEKIVEKCIQNPGKVVKVEIDKLHKKQGVVSTLWDFVCISNAEGVPREIQCMGIDISERINIEKQLKQSNERFEKISQATQDAIWDWDIVHNKLYWGEGYKTLFGYDILKEPSYAKWEECIHPDDFVQLKTELEKALTDKSVTKFKGDYRFKKADDTYAFVADKGIIIRDESGNPIRMLGAIIDITQRKENEALLQRLNHELEERAKALAVSNEELEQFAYIASHDLQEPLRMVTSFLGQLKKKYNHLLDEKAHTYIHFAVDGAARMRQIILDLLEFSRVGKHEDKKSTFSLTEIVDEICVLNQKIIQEKKAEIDFEKLPEITSFKTPVFQILQNLIGNSLKYSKDNVPPIIKIKAKKHQDSYLISVNDNGIGIEEAYFEKIFVIFQRLHNQESYSGTGMGLAIVKKIVDNLGGKVWLESINGVGSTFYIQLPK